MERADLLYSGLIFTALLLSLWTAGLVTAACVFFAPSVLRALSLANRPRSNAASRAATISSTERHVSQQPAATRTLSKATSLQSVPGRPLRSIQ